MQFMALVLLDVVHYSILFFPSIQRVDDIMQRTRAAADQLEENVRNHIHMQFRN